MNFWRLATIVFVTFSFVFPTKVFGQIRSRGNNIVGIHLAQPHDEDLLRARDLANSNGGEWGYVTLVIQENDRDLNKWQGIFEKLREYNLIPIIRLATTPEGDNWKRPESKSIESWVKFLNSLNWVVKERYILLFNEPNHATEWGGEVDPAGYAKVVEELARALKNANPDYFIMLGGLDASAPSSRPNYEDAGVFYDSVIEEIGVDDINTLIDGLSSHSYPNPGFIGSPYASGRGTVRTYEWELGYLQAKGIKPLPVFITETGWNGDELRRATIAEYYRYAFENIWSKDSRVYAVTPFVLNYQSEPFLKFSWVKPGNGGVFPEYETVKSLLKIAGDPIIRDTGKFAFKGPSEVVEQSTYHFQIEIENFGQAIWKDDSYKVEIEGLSGSEYLISPLGEIHPFEKKYLNVYITTSKKIEKKYVRFILKKKEDRVFESSVWNYNIVKLPTLNVAITQFPKIRSEGGRVEIQVFDEFEQMVYRKKEVPLVDGVAHIEKVENIALGPKYRVVVLNKYYLPRQTFVRFVKGSNNIKVKRMWPVDFSGDGAWSLEDIMSLIMNPQRLGLLLPL